MVEGCKGGGVAVKLPETRQPAWLVAFAKLGPLSADQSALLPASKIDDTKDFDEHLCEHRVDE